METRAVMNKAFDILRKELSVEEYLIYLQAITPRVGNATKELRDKTEIMSLKEVIERAKEIEMVVEQYLGFLLQVRIVFYSTFSNLNNTIKKEKE